MFNEKFVCAYAHANFFGLYLRCKLYSRGKLYSPTASYICVASYICGASGKIKSRHSLVAVLSNKKIIQIIQKF